MNNYQWLLQMDGADRKAWFDAEHVETKERALDGDTESESSNTDAVSERYATAFKWLDRLYYGKGGVIDNSLCDTPEQGEVVMPLESWREYLGTEPENADSREKLEADVFKAAEDMEMFYNGERFIDTRKIFGWLDRQAAITQHEITERWAEHLHPIERKCGDLRRKVDELEAERDKLKELNGYHAVQYELASEDCDRLQAQVDELTAERDNLEANNQQLHTLAGEQAAKIDELQEQVDELTNAGRKMSTELANMQDYITKVRAGRERYRSMCSEMATKIHDALMVMDEGMA